MRLEPFEVASIEAAARLTFGPDAVMRLFGSRVDPDRRGGDIDLHIETPAPVGIFRPKDKVPRTAVRPHRHAARRRACADRTDRLSRRDRSMTDAEERALLGRYMATLARLNAGFVACVEFAEPILPVPPERIDQLSFADDSTVLVFMKRFEQFEDALDRALKAISRIMEHGKIERLTSVDVTHRVHALGTLESDTVWAAAVRARNELAHEYPLDPVKRSDQINTAWQAHATLTHTWAAIQKFVEAEGLLDDRH